MKQVLDALLQRHPDGLEGQFILKTGNFVGAVRKAQLEGVPPDIYEAAVRMDDGKGNQFLTRVYFRAAELTLIIVRDGTSAIAVPDGMSKLIIPGGLRGGGN